MTGARWNHMSPTYTRTVEALKPALALGVSGCLGSGDLGEKHGGGRVVIHCARGSRYEERDEVDYDHNHHN